MNINLPLPHDKKMTVLLRIEPGCLGPDGSDHVEAFCKHAQKETATVDADYIHYEIIPRRDKSRAEIEYKVNNKNLTHDQAAKYLYLFSKSLDEFEEIFQERILCLIDEYTKKLKESR